MCGHAHDPRLQALDADWLTALLEFAQQSPMGAVGAKPPDLSLHADSGHGG